MVLLKVFLSGIAVPFLVPIAAIAISLPNKQLNLILNIGIK